MGELMFGGSVIALQHNHRQGNNSKKFAISISKSVKRFSFTIVLAKTQANFCHWILRKPRK